MADRNDTQQLPVEDILEAAEEEYTEEEYTEEAPEEEPVPREVPDPEPEEDVELENPFEPEGGKKKKKPAKKRKQEQGADDDEKAENAEKKRDLGRTLKKWAISLVAIAAAAMIIYGVAILLHRRNDGARYARQLAEQISRPLSEAQSEAGITLKSGSDNSTLSAVFPEHINMAESKKNCKIMGVKLPQWAIICHTEGDQLSEVTYYDYTALEKNPLGTVRKAYIEPATLMGPLTVEEVSEKLGLEPYSVTYLKDQTVQRSYRYCYKDPETEGLVSYTLNAVWDMAGQLRDVQTVRTDYVSLLLAEGES